MDYSLSDFAAIHRLATLVDTPLDEIRREFIETFHDRDAASIGLSLVACYKECGTDITSQTSRLTLLYLIYCTRALQNGVVRGGEEDQSIFPHQYDIDAHPFLPLFLRLLIKHQKDSRVSASSSHLSELNFCALPTTTQKEAFLIELFLTASADDLKEASLFNLTPNQLFAMELDGQTASCDVDLEERWQRLLHRHGLLSSGRENLVANAAKPKTDLVFESLIPPAFYFAFADQPLAPFTLEELPLIYPSLVGPWEEPEITPSTEKTLDANPTSQLQPREFAVDCLRRIATNQGSSQLSRSDTTKIQHMLLNDPSIFDDAGLKDHYHKLVCDQPDIAAELLLYELLRREEESMNLHFEILLHSELNVQSLLVFNRFISGCENRRIISHCINACEESTEVNQILMHRMVRMVCVFFTTLVRLRNFDIRPRLAELQSFAARFSSLREASNLYQATLQLK